MKILVYGAGVLGSQLAHALLAAGHDVTVLARSKRLQELKTDGLKIRHYLQRRTTVDAVKVTDRLDADDVYDLVFVVMQYQQTESVLQTIAQNRKTKNFAFIGNNPLPEKTARYIHQNSRMKKNIYFGFLMAAGRREDGFILSAHTGGVDSASLTIGSLDGGNLEIFSHLGKKIKLDLQHDIDSWLKCHAVFLLPVCFAICSCGGNLQKAGRKMNNDILDAILEGYDLIRSIGLTPAPPEDERLVRKQRPFAYAFIRFCAVTKTGRLMTGSHAINAPNETIALDQAIQSLRKQSRIGMPKWESLRKQMDISLAEW